MGGYFKEQSAPAAAYDDSAVHGISPRRLGRRSPEGGRDFVLFSQNACQRILLLGLLINPLAKHLLLRPHLMNKLIDSI
jgi:hypothetical protein